MTTTTPPDVKFTVHMHTHYKGYVPVTFPPSVACEALAAHQACSFDSQGCLVPLREQCLTDLTPLPDAVLLKTLVVW